MMYLNSQQQQQQKEKSNNIGRLTLQVKGTITEGGEGGGLIREGAYNRNLR